MPAPDTQSGGRPDFEEVMTREAYSYEGRYPKKDAPARRHGFAEGARWADKRASAALQEARDEARTLLGTSTDLGQMLAAETERRGAAEAENATLRERAELMKVALLDFAIHDDDCVPVTDGESSCSCGFTEAWFAIFDESKEALSNAHKSEGAGLREQVSAQDREMSALSSDKQTLMTAVTHWREQVEGLRAREIRVKNLMNEWLHQTWEPYAHPGILLRNAMKDPPAAPGDGALPPDARGEP